MGFSDEEIQELKTGFAYKCGHPDILTEELDALLARLDAAEWALLRYQIIPDEDLTAGIREAREAWRKSKEAGRV